MALDAHVKIQTGFPLDVRLTISEGIAVLRGPTGSGKSTTLRALAGLTPSAGFVRVDGAELSALPPEERRIGMVFQSSALFPHLDVLGNVAFGAPSIDEASRTLAALGLSEFRARKPDSLSGGERQKVALARALARRPRVLLLDEPFSALDAESRTTMLGLLKQLVAEKKLIALMVTHSAEDTASVGGVVITIENGKVSAGEGHSS